MGNHTIRYRAYGKVNLYLDILDRRVDGYTNIETIFQSVGLADTLTFKMAEEIVCSCDTPGVPVDDSNLAVKAALLLQVHAGYSLGARIHIDKNLPVAGGMAGGSADAAAALVGLNDLWQLHLGDSDLASLALRLGSDVPFCLRGGTTAATGRGEVFHTLPNLAESWLLLVFPGIPISAGALYNHPHIERSLETPMEGFTHAFSRAMQACRQGELERVIFNRFEAPAFLDHPELEMLKFKLLESGCVAAAMSGSGATIFGVCASKEHALELEREGWGCACVAAPTVDHGVQRVG